MSGGYNVTQQDRDEILQWTGQEWKEVGKMKKARSSHAVSIIRMDEKIKDFCV